MPNSYEGKLYNYINEYLVNDKLEYTGGNQSNSKTLEIGKQGGVALISFVNTKLGKFKSSESNVEVKHDGTLISKVSDNIITNEDLKCSIKFDLIIKIDNNSYKGVINLDLPCGEIIENGKAAIEITDFSNVIFKKENI